MSIAPKRSIAALAAAAACASSVTSRPTARRLGCAAKRWVTVCGLRAVATTASPLASARSATSAPSPRDAPVMNHVFMNNAPLWALRSGQQLGQLDQIAEGVAEEGEL